MATQDSPQQTKKTWENKMTYTLYYNFDELYYDDIVVDEVDYEYHVQLNLQDILEYEYENKFRKKYNCLSWYLEPGAKEFVKDVESRWWKNQIDTVSLYNDYKFIDWLKECYYEKALSRASLESLKSAMCFEEEYNFDN